jgi:GDP-4-dehydro-6-deoxy-D-mannose reductase
MRRNRVRALITGITGFAGGHLAQVLLDRGDEVFGIARDMGYTLNHLSHDIQPIIKDLQDVDVVQSTLEEISPDVIYHLAGQAFVPQAWANPWDTFANNVRPQLNILRSMINLDSSARLLVVASNEVYGHVSSDRLPVREDAPMRPENPYGVSKVTQDTLALQYHLSHGVDVIRVRAFNHIGPRQSPVFVSASFARQIAGIEAGLKAPVLNVGNLEAKRDFTDVIDVMRAYAMLADNGQSGEAYNIGTGRAYSIQQLLNVLLSFTKVKITIQQDPTRMRPSDVPVIYADNTKLKACTGWEPAINFEESLRRVLDYWRQQVSLEPAAH